MAVNQETRMVKMEEQIKLMQENAKRDKEELREEIKQNAVETRNAILEELRSIFGVAIPDKGKGIVGEGSKGVGEPAMIHSVPAVSVGAKAFCPVQKGFQQLRICCRLPRHVEIHS